MNTFDIKKIINFDYLPIKKGDNINTVIGFLGKPIDIHKSKKSNIVILKYNHIQITFIDNIIYAYTLYAINLNVPIFLDIFCDFLFLEKIVYVKEKGMADSIVIVLQNNIKCYFDSNEELHGISVEY